MELYVLVIVKFIALYLFLCTFLLLINLCTTWKTLTLIYILIKLFYFSSENNNKKIKFRKNLRNNNF